MARRGPTIADTALALIRERGPMTVEQLAPLVVEAGRTRAKDSVGAVRTAITWDRARLVEGRGGRWFALADQLDGAVFTLRPTAFERTNEIVLIRNDLALVRNLLHRDRWRHPLDEIHLDFLGEHFDLPWWDVDVVDVDEDGELVLDPGISLREEIGEETAEKLLAFLEELGLPRGEDDIENLRDLIREYSFESILHGPPGWLAALGPRDVLGLRVHAGAVQPERFDRRAISGIHVETAARRIRDLIEHLLDLLETDGPDPVVPLDVVLTLVATETPELLRRPLPPISELVAEAGFDIESGLITPLTPDSIVRLH